MSDLVTRLRRWTHAVDAVPASDLMDEAAAEIDRLRLTDAEREALAFMLRHAAVSADGWAFHDSADYQKHHDAVFALLERTK